MCKHCHYGNHFNQPDGPDEFSPQTILDYENIKSDLIKSAQIEKVQADKLLELEKV